MVLDETEIELFPNNNLNERMVGHWNWMMEMVKFLTRLLS